MKRDKFELTTWSEEELELIIAEATKPLIKAIRELQREVDELKKHDDHLQFQVNNLEERRVKDWNDLTKRIDYVFNVTEPRRY